MKEAPQSEAGSWDLEKVEERRLATSGRKMRHLIQNLASSLGRMILWLWRGEQGLPWIDVQQADMIVSFPIVLKMFYIGFELDNNYSTDGAATKEFKLEWLLLDPAFLLRCTVEIGLRIQARSWDLLATLRQNIWNKFDFVLVTFGLANTWILMVGTDR